LKALLIATTPPDGSSSKQTGSTNWTLRLAKVLDHRHQITLITTPPVHEPWLSEANVTVLTHEISSDISVFPRFIYSLTQGIYPSIWSLYSKETTNYLRKLSKEEFDVCWILDDYGGIYLKDIPAHLPTVFVRHYLFSMQESFLNNGTSLKKRMRGWYHKTTAQAFDRWTTQKAEIVTLGTSDSCEFLRNRVKGSRVEYLPPKPCDQPDPTDPANIRNPKGPNKRLLAVYLGDMSFVRNAEGVAWFIEKVLPCMSEPLRKLYHFKFIGRKPEPLPDTDHLPTGASVEFTGFVDNLATSLRDAQVAFIPVFGGNGVRLKTLNILGVGLPTVSTADALEGLSELQDCRDVLIANEAREFAKGLQSLSNTQVRLRISQDCLSTIGRFLDGANDAETLLLMSESIARSK
jgi:hypothetical protein